MAESRNLPVSMVEPVSGLAQPIRYLKGVGPSRIAALEKLGLRNLGDLLRHAPHRYEHWGPTRPIASLRLGEEVTIRGLVRAVKLQRMFWRKSTLHVLVEDASGSIEALFFNQPFLAERFVEGASVAFHGKVLGKKALFLSSPRVESPSFPFPPEGCIVPVYPATEGVGQGLLLSLIDQSLVRVRGAVEDFVPTETLRKLGCFPLGQAFEEIHKPRSLAGIEAARRRLAFDELLGMQRQLQENRARARREPGVRIRVETKLHERILKRIPFELTEGQKKVVAEIRTDLASGFPMRRLLQGDVGSGKTAVAIYSCLAAIGTKHQAAFMAPTEILAEQHFRVLRRYLEGSKVKVGLLVGSAKAAARRVLLQETVQGRVHLLVGTHALIQDEVRFRDLALVVIDEQHRFGVLQREKLFQKGRCPHLLSMTATPIPRTLALTVYGDLDVSTIAEKPPGRGSITTKWIPAKEEKKLLRRLAEHLSRGEQIYWVTPRIENEDEESRSALAAYEKLRKAFPKEPLGLAHGKLRAEERDRALDQFRQGKIRLLVATTLIEVGIDVPAARVIVIEGAERLGLAQLHQLRGRVGRGPGDSYCFLIGSPKAAERFRLLERSNDGFEIAEADLRTRGPGEISGLRQSGAFAGSVADLEKDLDLLFAARDLVRKLPAEAIPDSRPLLD